MAEQSTPSFPKISMVTIVLNNAKTIRRCVESVLSQEYPNLEYIVIDGVSTDGTLEILNEYEDRLATLISEKDTGIASAFNKGLSLCTGEIIGFINADDWLEPKALERVEKHMGSFDVLHANIRYYQGDNPKWVLKGNHNRLSKEMSVNHPATFIRKKVYEQFGNFDESYRCAMDYDLLLRFYSSGASFFHLDEVLANMSLGGTGDKAWKISAKEVQLAKDKILGRSLKHTLWYYRQFFAIATMKFLASLGLQHLVTWYRNLHFGSTKKWSDEG